jgi:hypothetical protein
MLQRSWFVVMALVLAGCTAPAVQNTPAPQVFTGRGQQATTKFTLPAGLVVFEMRHDGQSNFSIWLIGDRGQKKELLVNKMGPFNGSKAVQVPGGVYLLDVAADGNWSIQTR